MNIHHIGYLVDDIHAATNEMRRLGFETQGEVKTDPIRQVYITFMNNNGYVVELVQPVDQDSPMYSLRKKYRNTPYHICYQTSDIQHTIKTLCAEQGCMLIATPQPAVAMQNAPLVAFLMNTQIGMIELLENAER